MFGMATRIGWLLLAVTSGASAQNSEFAIRFFGTGVGPPGQQDRVRIHIDDNASGPDASAPCDVGAGSFTIDFWMRGLLSDNLTENNGGDFECSCFDWINGNIIIDRDVFGGTENDWGVSIAGGLVRFGTGRGDPPTADQDNTIEGSTSVLDGTWHHVALVRDSQSGRKSIHVDGVLDFESSINSSRDDISFPNGGAPGQLTPWGPYIVLAAEKHDAGAEYPSFNGFIDEVRIWNVARTSAQIEADYVKIIPSNTPGLVAYYRFEEGSGTFVADSSLANSPAGELIAGVPGNGQWVARAADAGLTAPVCGPSCDTNIPAASTWSLVCLAMVILAAGTLTVRIHQVRLNGDFRQFAPVEK